MTDASRVGSETWVLVLCPAQTGPSAPASCASGCAGYDSLGAASRAAPAGTGRYLVSKGSIAIDGISLTVAEVAGEDFMVNPDRVAFRLASEVYRAFGWNAKDIPFYDAATDRFVFPR